MKVCWMGFLGKSHSWSIVGQSICRELIKLGHDVHLFSTNGLQYFPEDLKQNLIGYVEENSKNVTGRLPDKIYDVKLSYTCPINWQNYLNGGKNKLVCWVYEWLIYPYGFAKNHN